MPEHKKPQLVIRSLEAGGWRLEILHGYNDVGGFCRRQVIEITFQPETLHSNLCRIDLVGVDTKNVSLDEAHGLVTYRNGYQ